MINRYTVIGQPVAHSLSPAIHALFGEMTQRRIAYTRTETTPECFVETVLEFERAGGRGCNITLPFKAQALDVCDRLHESARAAGAVNTIHMRRDGARVGHNTDGSGLCIDIERNLRMPLGGKRLLLLGAGGAARGVIAPLLARAPASLVVANRTVARARELADRFDSLGPITAVGYERLDARTRFDCVINATSLSLAGEVPPLPDAPFADGALAYDMMYGTDETAFCRWARRHGAARTADGFGMLVEQAADAFLVWEGVRPKVRMVSQRLQALLGRRAVA